MNPNDKDCNLLETTLREARAKTRMIKVDMEGILKTKKTE